MPEEAAGLTARKRHNVFRPRLTLIQTCPLFPYSLWAAPHPLDAANLVDMYHEIAQPFAFLYNLVPALGPGARVGIVDLDRPIGEHGTRPDLLRCELAAVGYEEVGVTRLTGDIGYLAVFKPPAEAARTPPHRSRFARPQKAEARLRNSLIDRREAAALIGQRPDGVAAQERIKPEAAAGGVDDKEPVEHHQEHVGPRPFRRAGVLVVDAEPQVQREQQRCHTDHPYAEAQDQAVAT